MSDASSRQGSIIDKPFSEFTLDELHAIMRLRVDVFVVEQACAYSELDGRDDEETTRHCWILEDGAIAAYARRLEDDGVARIGRVVTAPKHRGHGHAKRLVEHLTKTHRGPIILDAQSNLVEWYESLGFVRDGEEFIEDGIPHIPMRGIGEMP